MTTTPLPPIPLAIHLGAAARTSRALLDQVLDRAGLDFERWVVLRGLVTSEAAGAPLPTTRDLTTLLDEPDGHLRAPIRALLDAGLVAGDPAAPQLTDAGRTLARALVAEVAAISASVLEGADPADVEATVRVLQQMTVRGGARLASA
jgi:hypothetical protein